MGSMGSRQGERKVITPSKKAITYCIGLPAPFQIVHSKGSAPVETKQRRPRFKKSRSKRYTACSDMAERVGFEPTVPLLVHLISSQGRYNHFDTCPYPSPHTGILQHTLFHPECQGCGGEFYIETPPELSGGVSDVPNYFFRLRTSLAWATMCPAVSPNRSCR